MELPYTQPTSDEICLNCNLANINYIFHIHIRHYCRKYVFLYKFPSRYEPEPKHYHLHKHYDMGNNGL
ncbi:hypothetical protein HanIR_Chr01g0004671 [Helianthus annuus]|nr:hypothetical protein HanIR_Chr01g0004671 [Helianthus annuus]